MKISVCCPTYKRTDLLFEAMKPFLNDDRIGEVIICDDASPVHIFAEVQGFFNGIEKVFLHRNAVNFDCYKNKHKTVSLASNEYVLLIDSDNVFNTEFVDAIYAQHWSPERILQPTFAKPHFDSRKYNSLLANRKNVSKYANDSTFTTALNAMNFFINREKYLEVWDGSIDPVTSDSIYFNYKWLEAGNSIYFTPGLEYQHTMSLDSHYKLNNKRTPHGFHESILRKLKALR